MLRPRHRLFRRRTTWDVAKDNAYIFVTAAALIVSAFAWTGMSSSGPARPTQIAAAEPEALPPAASVSSSTIDEVIPPAPNAEAPAPVQTAQTTQTAQPAQLATPPAPKVKPSAPPSAHIAAVAETPPVVARPARATETKTRQERRATHTRASRQAQLVRTPPHRLRGKGPAVMARSEGNRSRPARHARNANDLDPFDCRVRKNKPPCFHSLSAQR